jgi:threonine/homoserine/homoserine lactone efflux protein
MQIAISMSVNGTYICMAGGLATFLQQKPAWVKWQRRVMGGILGCLALRMAVDRVK